MRSSDLYVTLSRNNTKSWLRSEINQLATEITLVLGYVLIERAGQSRIVPGCRLGVVVHEVHTSRIGETHFPSRWKWAKLRHGLLLYGAVVSILPAIHADVLLATWIHPCSCSCIVVNEVRSTFRGVALFPA